MDTSVLVALIAGGSSVVGSALVALLSYSKTIYRIEQLEKKVDKHNNVIERVFKLEQRVDDLDN